MSEAPKAGWYPDPKGAAEARYFDGSQWTEHVSSATSGDSSAEEANGSHQFARPPGNKERNWKWWQVAVVGLVTAAVASVLIPGESPKDESRGRADGASGSSPATTAPQLEVTAETLERDGNFWRGQPTDVRLGIAAACVPATAKRSDDELSFTLSAYRKRISSVEPSQVVEEIDKSYAEAAKGSGFLGPELEDPISDVCADAIGTVLEADAEAGERASKKQEAEWEASVQPGRFRATSVLVSRYLRVEERQKVRVATCSARTSCTIAFDTLVGDLGGLGDLVLGEYNRDFEEQLADQISPIFGRLFSDDKFEKGTVTAWIEVETKGGKRLKAPALAVTCDRAADSQIDWARVRSQGLREYCSYDLKPIRGIGGQ